MMCKTKHDPDNQSCLACFLCLKTFCNFARFWSFPWRNDLLVQVKSAVGEGTLKETSTALIRGKVWGREDRKHSICSIRALQKLEWELKLPCVQYVFLHFSVAKTCCFDKKSWVLFLNLASDKLKKQTAAIIIKIIQIKRQKPWQLLSHAKPCWFNNKYLLGE